jgi:hypothetical protein
MCQEMNTELDTMRAKAAFYFARMQELKLQNKTLRNAAQETKLEKLYDTEYERRRQMEVNTRMFNDHTYEKMRQRMRDNIGDDKQLRTQIGRERYYTSGPMNHLCTTYADQLYRVCETEQEVEVVYAKLHERASKTGKHQPFFTPSTSARATMAPQSVEGTSADFPIDITSEHHQARTEEKKHGRKSDGDNASD